MDFELDHLFVCTPAGAPEADRLVDFGLTEGSRNDHPGQGTANRRFFLCNAMLELLWVRDEAEVRSELIRPTRLWERWNYRQTGISPFGICIRPADRAPARKVELPFNTWAFRPPYLPSHFHIDVAVSATGSAEPMVFWTPFGGRPDRFAADRRQPLAHRIGFREIDGVRLTMPNSTIASPTLAALEKAGVAHFVTGNEHLLELSFDNESAGRSVDFRPDLPLIFRW